MRDFVKTVIAVGVALVVGFILGWIVGAVGKGEVEEDAAAAQQRARGAEASLKQARANSDQKAKKAKTVHRLMQAKARVLKAIVELYSNNYGLANQHLNVAHRRLRSVAKALGEKKGKKAQELTEAIGPVQQLIVRLDPKARDAILDLVQRIERIPGGR